MLLEADLIAKRATLRWLAQRHPQWTQQELAAVLGMSRSWVSKWLQRLRHADLQRPYQTGGEWDYSTSERFSYHSGIGVTAVMQKVVPE